MQKELRIRFLEENCWKCGHKYHVYYVLSNWNDSKLIFNEEVISKIKEWNNNILNIGVIKERYSNTMDDSYMSFGCPKCDALYGNHYLHDAIIDTMYEKKGCIDDITIKISE